MNEYKHIDASKFEFVQMDTKIFDKNSKLKLSGILETPCDVSCAINRA